MENYHGLIIAVENYHDDKHLPTVDYAFNDAEQFLQSMLELGCSSENFEYLAGDRATRTAIIQKIKEVSRNARRGDTIILYYAGHGFSSSNKNLISGVDTFLSSLEETTVEMTEILSVLESSEAKKIIGFLDCCHSGINFKTAERGPIAEFSTDDLKYRYSSAEHLIIFASCKDDEKSQTDLKRKHGVWSYFLLEALNGKVPEIYEDKILFSDRLQSYLSEQTFHRVKEISTTKKTQTPVKFGKETAERFIVADLSKKISGTVSEKKQPQMKFESADFSGSEEDSVKNLSGFKSGHKVPKDIDPYHNSWIQSISRQEIADELERVSSLLKSKMNFKRRDIKETVIENGYGQLDTEHFDYVVGIKQSDENPGEYIMIRRLENFKNSNILQEPLFNEIFKKTFNKLTFHLEKTDVMDVIDWIEDFNDKEKISVEYKNSDRESCRIFIDGLDGFIELTEYSLMIVHDQCKSPSSLVSESMASYTALADMGFPRLLNSQIVRISNSGI